MTIIKRDGQFIVRMEMGRSLDGKRVQIYERFAQKGEAQKREDELRAKKHTNKGVRRAPNITVGAFFDDRWLPHKVGKGLKRSTVHTYHRIYRAYVGPSLGQQLLVEVSPVQLNELYLRLSTDKARGGSGLSLHSVFHVHTLINDMFATAIKWGLVDGANPAGLADPPKKSSYYKTVPSWTNKEAALAYRWLCERGDSLETLWLLFLTAGLRRGEALALKWTDIDWEAATLHVERSVSDLPGQPLEVTRTKTRNGVRTLALGPDMIASFKKQARTQKLAKWAAQGGYVDRGLIFADATGDYLVPNSVTNRFTRLVRLMCADLGIPSLSVHGLRHTNVQLAMRANIQPKIVSDRAGHNSMSFTHDVYGETDVEMQRPAASAIEDLVAGRPVQTDIGRRRTEMT